MVTYRKPYRVKKKKSILKNKNFWLIVLFLSLVGVILYFVFFASIFQINEIKISGNQKISDETLSKFIQEKINQKILFWTIKSIFLIKKIEPEILKEFIQIEKVNLKKQFPNKLILEITERKEFACFCRSEKCFLIDKSGLIFEEITTPCLLNLIIKDFKDENLVLGEQVIDEDAFIKIQDIQQKLKNDLQIQISEFDILKEKLVAKTSENWEIYFNLEKDINWQLTQLKTILESKISLEKKNSLEYIDLRFSKIFWKFK